MSCCCCCCLVVEKKDFSHKLVLHRARRGQDGLRLPLAHNFDRFVRFARASFITLDTIGSFSINKASRQTFPITSLSSRKRFVINHSKASCLHLSPAMEQRKEWSYDTKALLRMLFDVRLLNSFYSLFGPVFEAKFSALFEALKSICRKFFMIPRYEQRRDISKRA